MVLIGPEPYPHLWDMLTCSTSPLWDLSPTPPMGYAHLQHVPPVDQMGGDHLRGRDAAGIIQLDQVGSIRREVEELYVGSKRAQLMHVERTLNLMRKV